MQQTAQNLVAVKFLPAAVFLHYHVGDFVDTFIRGKALVAALTLAPPPNRIGLFALARVHHTVLRKPAVRTLHLVCFDSNKIDSRDIGCPILSKESFERRAFLVQASVD